MRRIERVATVGSMFMALGLAISGKQAAAAEPRLADEMRGSWRSLSCELRPSAGEDGVVPFYLTRNFTYDGEAFSGSITVFADPLCEAPMAEYDFAGHLEADGDSPAIAGAEQVNYVLDEALSLTPIDTAFADQLNALPAGSCGPDPWQVGTVQDILASGCVLLELEPGEIYTDYDLVYVRGDLLFFGAKHVDGRDFSTPENRPMQLQIPMERVN
ncbi:MAG: hypothetical protein AAF414_13795 [Pseudomonadota bacterium]